MANFTAADVKKLREQTGAGMMAAKNALVDADGDFDKAIEALRIKGAKDMGKRADRDAAEGLVATSGNTMIELNAETDFVAKNDEFIALAEKIVAVAAAGKFTDVEALKGADAGNGQTVNDLIDALAVKIREKLQLRRVATVEGDNVAAYAHKRSADLPPAVGVLVAYTGDDAEAARMVAMQVAAMKASYLSREDVPAELVAKEREIAEKTTREEGKPEAALPKIVEGRLGGFFKQVALLEQPYITDSKKTVADIVKEAGITITDFKRFEIGAE